MFDTMTMTKAAGALCGSLLVYLLGGWAAGTLYSTGGGHGGEHAQAYVIDTGTSAEAETPAKADTGTSAEAETPAETPTEGDTGATAEAETPAEGGSGFAALLAAADAAAGQKVFGKCRACHKVDGANATGPHLDGVVNRAKASVAGFNYSDGLKAMAGDVWSPENLNAFLTNPKAYAPGNKMSFAGLAKEEERVNLIAYLASLN